MKVGNEEKECKDWSTADATNDAERLACSRCNPARRAHRRLSSLLITTAASFTIGLWLHLPICALDLWNCTISRPFKNLLFYSKPGCDIIPLLKHFAVWQTIRACSITNAKGCGASLASTFEIRISALTWVIFQTLKSYSKSTFLFC